MPRKKKENATVFDNDLEGKLPDFDIIPYGELRFAAITPDPSEKAEFDALYAGNQLSAPDVASWMERGLKFSLRPDNGGRTITASLIGFHRKSDNAGFVLTARAASADRAVSFLAYKDRVLCRGRSWKEAGKARAGVAGDLS